MFVSLRTLSLPTEREGERDAIIATLRATAAELPGVLSSWVARVSPVAAINAGHIVWRLTFATEREALAAPFEANWSMRIAPLLSGMQQIGVGYRFTRSSLRPASSGIWRALIFRVMPQGFPRRANDLERELLLLPKYVGSIRSWALSRVSTIEGPKGFTHVWEQEFDKLEGLTADYMIHPVHWGLLDRYFDAECPEYVVDPHLIQVIGEIDSTIIGRVPDTGPMSD